MTDANLWTAVLEKIREEISKPSFDTWFAGIEATIDNDVLILTAPNEFAAEWLKDRYQPLIVAKVAECTGKIYKIKITYPMKNAFQSISRQHKENNQLEEWIEQCVEKKTKELTEIVKDHEKRIQELEEMLETEEIYNKFIPFEDELEPQKTCFDIDGYIEVVDGDEETFYTEFQDWLNSKGWSFVAVKKDSEE